MSIGPLSLESAAIICVALFVGSIAKAVTGFGLPMVSVPLLAGFLGVERAVVVMIIPTFVSNAWLMWEHRAQAGAARGMVVFLAAGIVGTVAGSWLLVALSGRALALILAAWLGSYLVLQLVRPGLRLAAEPAPAVTGAVGLAAGLCQGATGASGPVAGPWFHAFGLAPSAYVFSVSTVFFTLAATQMASVASFGLVDEERLLEGLVALAPIALGLPLGIRLARTLDRRVFNWCLLAMLWALEARLLWQGLRFG
ncbi:MAG TPA: sulfite exporter TauE/SafE family protein [Alphaproteobacteria bacterium]